MRADGELKSISERVADLRALIEAILGGAAFADAAKASRLDERTFQMSLACSARGWAKDLGSGTEGCVHSSSVEDDTANQKLGWRHGLQPVHTLISERARTKARASIAEFNSRKSPSSTYFSRTHPDRAGRCLASVRRACFQRGD